MQQDLYCLNCGYNVRGLDGDPVQCPECGHQNRREDLLVPAKEIKKSLRRLETGAAWCGAMTATVLLYLVPLFVVSFYTSSSPPQWIRRVLALFIALCFVFWVVGIVHFRNSCDNKPGWIRALVVFCAHACVISAIVVVAFGMVILGAYNIVMFWGSLPFRELVVGAAAFVFLIAAAWWVYRHAKAGIHQLQRETAAREARKRLPFDHPSTHSKRGNS